MPIDHFMGNRGPGMHIAPLLAWLDSRLRRLIVLRYFAGTNAMRRYVCDRDRVVLRHMRP